MKTKYCSKCKKVLPISEFYNNKTHKDNLTTYCKKCHDNSSMIWYIKHPNYKIKQTKKWQKKYPIKWRLQKIKISAERRNHEWAIPNDIGYALISSPCAYCGKIQENFNGLDRINNSKEYTINNVVSCYTKCNKMKSDITVKKFLKHIEKIYKYNMGYKWE